MGLDARFVFGKHGRYGIGHAWVMFFRDGRCYLLEPQARPLGLRLPRLSTLAYEPRFSVGWNGAALKYYAHKQDPEFHSTWRSVVPLIPEWVSIWGWFWLRVLVRFPYVMARKVWRRVFRKGDSPKTVQAPTDGRL
jgi:hypothetical protein